MEIFGDQYSHDHSLSTTDLFYFWNSFHMLNALDEEDNSKISETNSSKIRLDFGWAKSGLLEVFKTWTSGYRGNSTMNYSYKRNDVAEFVYL